MNRRDIEDAIQRELEEWPNCSVKFVEGSKHPKAKLTYQDPENADPVMVSVTYPGTPSSISSLPNTLADVRRSLRSLGAVRTKPDPSKEEDEAPYRKPNNGAELRENPVVAEPVAPQPDIKDQLVAAGVPVPETGTVTAPAVITEPAQLRLGPGVYDDLLPEEYLNDPCEDPSLSSSIAKHLIQESALHARNEHGRLNPNKEPIDSHQFRVGRAFHTMVLGKGNPIEVLDFADYRKDAAKSARDSLVSQGYTPLLKHQYENLVPMVESFKWQMRQRPDMAYAFAGGVPERVYIWKEETRYGPVYCRMMVDWTPHSGGLVPDLKTTAAEAFTQWGSRTMWDTGCDIQDAWYRRGFRAMGRDVDALMFCVTETSAPYGLMHHRIEPYSQDEADQMIGYAIELWAYCLHNNRWPGYPREMAWQQRPGWRSQNFESRKSAGLLSVETVDEQIEQMKLSGAARASLPDNDQIIEPTDDNPFGLPPVNQEA